MEIFMFKKMIEKAVNDKFSSLYKKYNGDVADAIFYGWITEYSRDYLSVSRAQINQKITDKISAIVNSKIKEYVHNDKQELLDYIKSEEFLDSIIERIKNKQLNA
jgi:hypothetical protein